MGTFVNPWGSQTTSQPTQTSKPVSTSKPTQTSKFVNPFAGQMIAQPTSQPVSSPQSNPSIISDPNAIKDIQRQAGEALNQNQGFFQTILTKTAPVVGQALQFAKDTVKQVKDFLPQTKEYAKQAVKNPVDTAAGGGSAQLKFFGSLAGLVQKGVASVAGITVPERWDISKQVEALDELNKTLIEKTSKTKQESDAKQKAFATGQFLGQMLPYALGSEVAGASVGSKLLVPTAQKFLPGAVKFVPRINEAISALGVGQISHEEKNGTRVDQLKNDLIMLSMFETGGLLFRGLSKGTKGLISKTVNEVKGKPKINFETIEPKIEAVKTAIKEDTGKTLPVLAVQEMADGTDNLLINNYRKQFKNEKLLNADNVREVYTPEGYNRINSAEFHDRSSALTNKIFNEDIANLKPGDNYLFTAGSSGAGKSAALKNYPDILSTVNAGLDGNFSSASSIKKLDKVIKTEAKPTIVFVNRDAVDAWMNGVVKRAINPENGRVVPLDVFLDNLENSPKRVLEAYQKYGDKVDIQVLDNSFGAGNAKLVDQPIEFLKQKSYNIENVRQEILKLTQDKIQDGTIKPNTAKALLGETNSPINGQKSQPQRQSGNESPLTAPSKLGLRVEQTAIEKKLTNELKDLPTYEKMSMKDEAQKAADLINSDPEKAFNIALGKETPPVGVKAESIFKAVEASITTPEQALQLAKSPLVREASELGQRIKALDVKTSESPVEAIKQVLNARAKAIEGKFESVDRATAKIVKNIESKVKTPDKYDWNKFVESIKC